ncbi:unnamed protein product [Mytilus coruscus]|uniref:BHLH domain-containing protein n=1 Tax=Mytilus coruscus TaxID=42192 RepID=A0A6J8DN15_MYTCO|nr:unnamed protein product [Mytilus coruscus]
MENTFSMEYSKMITGQQYNEPDEYCSYESFNTYDCHIPRDYCESGHINTDKPMDCNFSEFSYDQQNMCYNTNNTYYNSDNSSDYSWEYLSEEDVGENRKRKTIQKTGSGSKVQPVKVRECATERERNRMHQLNDAFDSLRQVVPKTNLNDQQKLSKIGTLKLAIQYISALTNVLRTSGVEISPIPTTTDGDRRGRRRNCRKRS